MVMRRGPGTAYRSAKTLQYLLTRDRRAVWRFLRADLPLPLGPRLALLGRFLRITNAVRGYHTLGEMLAATTEILARSGRPGLTVVEAGCGFGASTAKLSLAVRAARGRLIVCDSFRGIPENSERHLHLDGRPIVFRRGAYRGRLSSVQRTLARHGAAEVCTLRKGWFADTLASLDLQVDVAVLDVDLLESTRTCITQLFPRLSPGGVLISLDGQLQATHALLADQRFWRDQVGVAPPLIDGLGSAKLLTIRPAWPA